MILLAASIFLAQASAGQVAPPPQACSGDDHSALDLWIGEWDVYRNGHETVVARSTIEMPYEGCAIRENWMPFGGKSGGSSANSRPATVLRGRRAPISSIAGVARTDLGTIDHDALIESVARL